MVPSYTVKHAVHMSMRPVATGLVDHAALRCCRMYDHDGVGCSAGPTNQSFAIR